MLEGLRTDEETVQRVIILYVYGCLRQAVVHALELDERTAAGQKRAGIHHLSQWHKCLNTLDKRTEALASVFK